MRRFVFGLMGRGGVAARRGLLSRSHIAQIKQVTPLGNGRTMDRSNGGGGEIRPSDHDTSGTLIGTTEGSVSSLEFFLTLQSDPKFRQSESKYRRMKWNRLEICVKFTCTKSSSCHSFEYFNATVGLGLSATARHKSVGMRRRRHNRNVIQRDRDREWPRRLRESTPTVAE